MPPKFWKKFSQSGAKSSRRGRGPHHLPSPRMAESRWPPSANGTPGCRAWDTGDGVTRSTRVTGVKLLWNMRKNESFGEIPADFGRISGYFWFKTETVYHMDLFRKGAWASNILLPVCIRGSKHDVPWDFEAPRWFFLDLNHENMGRWPMVISWTQPTKYGGRMGNLIQGGAPPDVNVGF